MAKAEDGSASFWTTNFSGTARTKVWYAFFDRGGGDRKLCAERVRLLLLREEGLLQLRGVSDALNDVAAFFLVSPDELVPSIIEAMFVALFDVSNNPPWAPTGWKTFTGAVNEVLYQERIGFEFVGGTLVEKDSQELHAEVIAPTLRLLSGRPGWEDVEKAYQRALEEISDGHPDDAITDAGAALQEALVKLGCEGNALGPLIASGLKKRLFAQHDAKLLSWASADRSELGDGHQGASPATRHDAWLAVHVVGAIILRLTGPTRSSHE
jgi:hypothetical protein